jgi:hydrogenase expression/formation protein HypC
MCLGIPGKIIEIYEANDLHMGKVDFGGVTREVCLAYVPEAQIGNYTIVHVGFALNVLDEAEALETLQLLREIGALDEELGAEADAVQVPPSSSGGSAAAALN